MRYKTRNNIIFFIYILLFSSILVSCEKKTGVLYQWGGQPNSQIPLYDKNTDTFGEIEWKDFGEMGTHPKYKGEISGGEPDGLGILTYENGTKYTGLFEDGKIKDGKGKYDFSNGDKYEGDIGTIKPRRPGVLQGQGTYTWSNGDKYEGEFKDGKQHGQGEFVVDDLMESWSGEFKDGKRWNVTIIDLNLGEDFRFDYYFEGKEMITSELLPNLLKTNNGVMKHCAMVDDDPNYIKKDKNGKLVGTMFEELYRYSEQTDLKIEYFFEKTILDCFVGMEKGKYDVIANIVLPSGNRKSRNFSKLGSKIKSHAKMYHFKDKVDRGNVYFFLSNKSPFSKFPDEIEKSIKMYF